MILLIGGALMVYGENAHSRYFSEDAFKKLRGNNNLTDKFEIRKWGVI